MIAGNIISRHVYYRVLVIIHVYEYGVIYEQLDARIIVNRLPRGCV